MVSMVKMTLERLAQMSQQQFTEIDARFDTLENNMRDREENMSSALQALANQMDAGFATILLALRPLQKDMKEFKERVIRLEKR